MSARQLAQAELPEIVRQVLAETGLSAGDLAIEITETALIEESSVPAASLGALKSLGVKILLDDFGTGYSSLSHLQRFPIDALKIDRSFVMHLGSGEDDARSCARSQRWRARSASRSWRRAWRPPSRRRSAGAGLRLGAGVLLRASGPTLGDRVADPLRLTGRYGMIRKLVRTARPRLPVAPSGVATRR